MSGHRLIIAWAACSASSSFRPSMRARTPRGAASLFAWQFLQKRVWGWGRWAAACVTTDGADLAASSLARQHCLYFLPLPQGQGSLRPILAISIDAAGKDDALVPDTACRSQIP